jgi:prevent-host-death family protein
MEKTLGVMEAENKFSEFVRGVELNGDSVVVERDGKAVAVLISLKDYETLKHQRRQRFFELLHKAQENANLSEAEAEKLAEEAVQAIRQGKPSLL